MTQVTLTVTGILIAIFIFGLKTGVGCGFSNVGKREILAIAGSYLVLSLFVGGVVGNVSMENYAKISNLGLGIHVLLSLFLVGAGIYTQKKWSSGKDVSKRTFLFISLPCPVCLAALAFCCMLLAASLDISGVKVGLLVGTAFFASVLLSSFGFKKLGKSPDTLGSAMLLLGIYYLLAAMLIPAYIKTKQLNLVPLSGGNTGFIPLTLCAIVIMGGFLLEQVRHKQ
ncbi:TPA: DUF2162 domain-containing protein [Methanosarcina acetivorans]|uniref:Membrane transporter n=2 Tax=Methanosarcina acetivorans TaxID=2214 RepID=Q8THT5_METAC|nr:DUF2162 domain-containing protein [Methanosarcina acetivorans]AAM07768.1 conserved hypothetical protein [Methanosarcina acetivorans C2A]HIH95434.1 DUF2162 domain-containing protein [Methanosarcina acetivorans]